MLLREYELAKAIFFAFRHILCFVCSRFWRRMLRTMRSFCSFDIEAMCFLRCFLNHFLIDLGLGTSELEEVLFLFLVLDPALTTPNAFAIFPAARPAEAETARKNDVDAADEDDEAELPPAVAEAVTSAGGGGGGMLLLALMVIRLLSGKILCVFWFLFSW